jgi:uncharacterized protein with PIN domain
MGTYGVTVDDLLDKFDEFLHDQEGDISAQTIAECWNILAARNDWPDKLFGHEDLIEVEQLVDALQEQLKSFKENITVAKAKKGNGSLKKFTEAPDGTK